MYKISRGFKDKYFLAKQFYKENGHLRIPLNYIVEKDEKEISLGLWIHNLRYVKSGNNSSRNVNLTIADEHFLNKIGMEWNIYDDNFMENYNYLISNSKGLEIRNILENSYIKQWIDNIKAKYARGMLKGFRKELYENNQELFSIEYLKWEYNYSLAKQFYEKNGHLNIPVNLVMHGFKIGNWITTQRKIFEKGLLDKEKVMKLETIEMIWCLSEYNFITNELNVYNKKRYYEKLKDRFMQFLDMQEDIIFEDEEQVKELGYKFQKYLDYTKK